MRELTHYEFSLVSAGCDAAENCADNAFNTLLAIPVFFGSAGAVAGGLIGASKYGPLGAIVGIPAGAVAMGVVFPLVALTGAMIAIYPYLYAANYFANSNTGS